MNIEDTAVDYMNLKIMLGFGSGNMSVAYLTRHMAFNEDGCIVDQRYTLNPTADFNEETISLLRDTLRGMEAELNHLLLKNKTKEEA